MCPREKFWQSSKANGKISSHSIWHIALFWTLDTHDKWKFHYTFLHCCNPLFISCELLTFFCHASSIKVLFAWYNCPQASKSNLFFFIMVMWGPLIESDYSTSHVTEGAGKVRSICVGLGNDENLLDFKESMQVEKLRGMAMSRNWYSDHTPGRRQRDVLHVQLDLSFMPFPKDMPFLHNTLIKEWQRSVVFHRWMFAFSRMLLNFSILSDCK